MWGLWETGIKFHFVCEMITQNQMEEIADVL